MPGTTRPAVQPAFLCRSRVTAAARRALDIAQADGTVQDEEKVVLEKIAKRLSVDVTKFDF